jgi:hypothetical protein
MALPTEFLTLDHALTLVGMGMTLFLIVQATKELPRIKGIPTLLYAWALGSLLLLVGTVIRAWPQVVWAEALYLSVINGVLAAAVAVFGHQGANRLGVLRDCPGRRSRDGFGRSSGA